MAGNETDLPPVQARFPKPAETLNDLNRSYEWNVLFSKSSLIVSKRDKSY